MADGVRIHGVDSLSRKLTTLKTDGNRQARIEVRRSLVNIQNAAKRRSPRDPQRPPKDPSRKVTGRLRNSITHEVASDGLSGRSGTNTEYAPYQELGTRTIPPRPFLFPAFEQERERFVAALRKIGRISNELPRRGGLA